MNNRGRSQFLLRIRTATQPDLKTAAVVNKNTITTSFSTPEINRRLKRQFSSIKSDRPIADVVESSPTSGVATVVETPGGTHLHRHKNYGALTVYSSHQSKKISNTSIHSKQFNTAVLANTPIQDAAGLTQKEMRVLITPELLKQVAEAHKKNSNRRVCSQNKVMVKIGTPEKEGSAMHYVQSLMTYDQENIYEWLHLIAYRMIGFEGQSVENLTAGSKNCNKDMKLIENKMSLLAEKYPKGFWVTATVNLLHDTHIAKIINYRIETPDFKLQLTYNPHTPTKPHQTVNEYVGGLVAVLGCFSEDHSRSTDVADKDFAVCQLSF